MSNGKPTPQPLSWRGWKTRPWIRLLSGTTLEPSTAAQRHGVVYVYGEFGGGSLVSRAGLGIAWSGVQGLPRHTGVLEGAAPGRVVQRCHVMSGEPYRETRALYWFAERRGCFESLVGLGNEVGAGQTVGRIHPLDGTVSEPREVVAWVPGTSRLPSRPAAGGER